MITSVPFGTYFPGPAHAPDLDLLGVSARLARRPRPVFRRGRRGYGSQPRAPIHNPHDHRLFGILRLRRRDVLRSAAGDLRGREASLPLLRHLRDLLTGVLRRPGAGGLAAPAY